MKSGLIDKNGKEVKVGDHVIMDYAIGDFLFDVTYEDGAFCLRLPGTEAFSQGVTFRDAKAQAMKAGKEFTFEIITL